mgnify:CR=1 FL=1
MKQKLKALASLCLALALTLCLTLPAWAAGLTAESTGAVTITGLAENTDVTVTAYKIMSVNWHNNEGTPLYEAPEDPTYKWEESVATWLESMTQQESNYSAYKDESGNVTDAFEGIGADPAAKFYTDLAKEIKEQNSTLASLTHEVLNITGNEGAYTASGNLAMGGYLVLVEGGTKIYSPVFLTVMPTYNDETDSWEMPDDTKPATAIVKQQELTFEKKIVKTTDAGEILLDKDTVAINDSVTFRLTAGVPKYLENAAGKTFKISDNLPEGMTLEDNPVFTVKGYTNDNTDGTELSSTDYTVAQPADTGMDFTLAFTYDQIKDYSKITVEYSVTMNKNTVVFDGDNANGTENRAVLTYVKDQLTGATETLEDEAIVYSYGIQVTKKGESSGEGQAEPLLTGAVFTLKKDGTDTTAISFVKADDGSYRVADSTETGDATTELTVGTSDPMKGILKLSGLDVGDYLLTEVQAPAGYNKLSAPISITIEDEDDGVGTPNAGPNGKPEYTSTDQDGASTEVEAADGYVPVTVINTQGFTLPTTGGMGTVLFTAGGVVLMGAGLVLLVVFLRRRRAK